MKCADAANPSICRGAQQIFPSISASSQGFSTAVWVFFGLEKEAAVHAFVAPGVDEHVQTTVAESWVEFFRRLKLFFASFFWEWS